MNRLRCFTGTRLQQEERSGGLAVVEANLGSQVVSCDVIWDACERNEKKTIWKECGRLIVDGWYASYSHGDLISVSRRAHRTFRTDHTTQSWDLTIFTIPMSKLTE